MVSLAGSEGATAFGEIISKILGTSGSFVTAELNFSFSKWIGIFEMPSSFLDFSGGGMASLFSGEVGSLDGFVVCSIEGGIGGLPKSPNLKSTTFDAVLAFVCDVSAVIAVLACCLFSIFVCLGHFYQSQSLFG